MRKLISKMEGDKYSPYMEEWTLENDLSVTIHFGKKYTEIAISSNSGCVTDQVYELLKKKCLKNITLGGIGSPAILLGNIPLEIFFDYVETIDPLNLEPGKSY